MLNQQERDFVEDCLKHDPPLTTKDMMIILLLSGLTSVAPDEVLATAETLAIDIEAYRRERDT